MNKTFSLLLTTLLLLASCTATTPNNPPPSPHETPFLHPGILHTRTELNFIKQKVAAHEEPWSTAWQALQKSPKASRDYQPRPIPNLFRGSRNNPNYGANDWLIAGGVAYTHAIEYIITNNPAHAQKAIQILNAYSTTVQSVKGSDAPLVTGEATVLYCNAAEIIRYTSTLWKPEDQQKFADLLRNVLYPVIKDFKPGNNGNWDAAMIQSMLAIGIYLDDRDMFNRAVAQATSPTSNGAIQNYFNDFGECQESGRDQGHAQMGLGFLGTACEIAWKQHVDLYAAFDNRLAKGTEYICKYNLGNDVPYVEYISVAGHNDFPNISPQSRGRFSSIYEKIYHHYHDLKHLDMPYTKQVIDKQRPELDITNSHTPWGTLMFANLPN